MDLNAIEFLLQTESPNIADLIMKIIGAIKVIGDAVAQLVAFLFSSFGFPLPVQFINILIMALLFFTIMKIGSSVSKLVLMVLVFLMISSSLSLFNFPSL